MCRGIGGDDGLPGEESIDDAALLQIVRRHFNLHSVSWENAYAMDAHATREMTEERMTFRLFTGDTDFERGIGIRFLHNADQFNNVLRHREMRGVKSRWILPMDLSISKPYPRNIPGYG